MDLTCMWPLKENMMSSRMGRFLGGSIVIIINIVKIIIIIVIIVITIKIIAVVTIMIVNITVINIIIIFAIIRLGVGKAFGELAILYNCKRTASVKAIEVCYDNVIIMIVPWNCLLFCYEFSFE